MLGTAQIVENSSVRYCKWKASEYVAIITDANTDLDT